MQKNCAKDITLLCEKQKYKSTLLDCIGGLDLMDSGSIQVDGKEIFGLPQDKLSDYRRENLGFSVL